MTEPATPCNAAAQGEACPMALVRCLDMSHWQGAPDWPLVAQWLGADGFAYHKITEGAGGAKSVDSMVRLNLPNMRAAGIASGVYHFARFTTEAQALAEAAHFLDTYEALHEPGDLAPMLDLEEPQVGHADIGGPALAWLDRVGEVLGVACYVYTSPAFAMAHGFATVPRLAEFPLWLADWTPPADVPAPWSDWAIWQTGKAHVPGIVGECDVNQARRVAG